MKHRIISTSGRRAAGWLLGLALLFTGFAALAQQDPPGRVAHLNFHQGTLSFSPAGDDSWYDVVPNRPITTGDRLWTDRNARVELHLGSATLRLDGQTSIAMSELDDDTARITAQQGRLQVRVREELAGQRFEIDTGNLAVVIDAPGDYRIEADPAAGTTRVAIAAGSATLYGEGGESMPLGAQQQLTVSGRNLAAVSGAPVRAGNDAFERWVAERDRIEEQSISARYVSRDVIGYQQLDNYGDWQNVPEYGSVWYPRNVDADWAPYRDGQWAEVAPWGWTWIDAAPWGFAPSHYGRWARIGPRWGWVPGRPNVRHVYAPALVGFVGGGNVAGARNGVGWFPLAPGERWRPHYRASQRYIDEVNRTIAHQQQLARADYLHRNTPGALSLVPMDIFGRGPIARRDFLRVPEDRLAQMPIATAVPVLPRGERRFGGVGRPAASLPPPAIQAREQQQLQFRQAQQAQQQLQLQQAQRIQQMQQGQPLRQQQQELQQRAAEAQAQQQMQPQALRQQQEMQQR
ncbi:chromosome partitioning protein ParA, partial [Variovorax paradoxus]|nr:chromosome partitioning protein ParA [Variovorax paradoxus]